MNTNLSDKELRPNSPATEDQIAAAQAEIGCKLPSAYLTFVRNSNGGEGFIGENYVQLWRMTGEWLK
jgi:hypothetical protein